VQAKSNDQMKLMTEDKHTDEDGNSPLGISSTTDLKFHKPAYIQQLLK